ncbi:hypothetical protein PPTG_07781 [Phytophthora nicotianae INRA-310]|uniref:Uncharacterized protein n=1 Tax=Phytophthora nicotianae (strain INRA-310) TaxID=761204 RepID=W2QPD1_PHYN3|nr:hypothetical protein PPTG_07781 [Phytophthora nicotianae INRA-310]ETN14120.1 hypothetical protein PPTG_07781 [Phytophthora nicotianae INRA-310]
MLRQLPPPPSPPLSPSQDFAATLISVCDSSAVTPSECAEDSQVFRVQLAQGTNIDEAASSQENTAPAPSQEQAAPVSSQDDVRGDESEEDEDEPLEDSDEEDRSPDDDPDDVEVVTGESAGSEVEEDISINLIENDVRQCVTDLINGDECEMGCLKGKSRELEWLTCSLGQMTKTEKTTCILTLVGVLMQTATRRRGKGEREKFHYYLPFVGQVCRSAFAHCLGVKPLTIQRYKLRVREENIAAKEHGNKPCKNTSSIDAVWLVKWFKEFAAETAW